MASIIIAGDTSGAITLASPAVAGSNTLTLPSSTDTLVGKATTDTLTNKTLTSPTISGTPVMGASLITSGTAVASTSGTSIDFTGIPSWVKRITVMFNGVSTNGTSYVQVQLGAGSVTTSGYAGSSSFVNGTNACNWAAYTSGFGINMTSASALRSGQLTITNVSAYIWSCSGVIGDNVVSASFTASVVTLGGTLDRVRITTANGTDTFDAGSINILYE